MDTMKRSKDIILYTVLVVLGLYFLFQGLVLAKAFLAPLVLALILAFLMLPVSEKLESWGFRRIYATIVSTITLLLVVLGFVTVIFLQVRDFTDDWGKVQNQFDEMLKNIEVYLIENTPLSESATRSIVSTAEMNHEQPPDNQNQDNQQQQQKPRDDDEGLPEQAERKEIVENSEDRVFLVMANIVGFMTDILIVLVYIFMFLQFRHKFLKFILRMVPPKRRKKVLDIVVHSTSVSRKYLAGKLFLMVILAILYYIGLSISGLDNALLISLISAALSIIPVVGNFIGYFIALAVSMVTNGDISTALSITATYIVAQIIDTYILQPIVLGDKVGVHPFFVILSVILGYQVWGIIGMVVSVPVFGVLAIIFRNTETTSPLGFLLSTEEPEDVPME
ncbi:MAG: AI-2E family transporter [Bacteroidetes bacterium]|nr:MAG: AI-2E family transporter [Bacteroidota bacterium]